MLSVAIPGPSYRLDIVTLPGYVWRKKLRRAVLLDTLAKVPSCLIGMEACATAHYWAREIAALGHQVRLMPPSYVRRQKNDAADAEAICEAVRRPTMRFVPVKRVLSG